MECVDKCPFAALEVSGGRVEVNAGCKLCKICIKLCPVQAIRMEGDVRLKADVGQWKDILVYAEVSGGRIHPVVLELIGKAGELAAKVGQKVHCVCIGEAAHNAAQTLLNYGVDKVFVYDDPGYRFFSAEPYADAFADCIRLLKPSVVLVGATAAGRSLAPRVATRFQTGLTADCTVLDIRENTDLVQIRPAFGGNIMAKIVTPRTRPQFATVRYKVMDPARPVAEKSGRIELRKVDKAAASRLKVLDSVSKSAQAGISEAEVLIAVGRGVKNPKDLAMLERLAQALGAQVACSRPLVECGWLPYTQQIGLSGRTVKPKLIITCGISGAVQFTACMRTAECIIAINSDPDAPIFKTAHYGIVGDLYEIIPLLTEKLEKKVTA